MENWLERLRRRIVGARPTAAQGNVSPGAEAEDLAATLLTRQGLKILSRNVRCRGGEVDLIALEGATVVFVEVRLRRNRQFGGPAASIGPAKQARVTLAARHWLAGTGRRWQTAPCRFDAVVLAELSLGSVEWIRGAFPEKV
ncbi:MAG: YraN family protein [Zoogloeaceae bacterium]|nr:YraN family protein [Zoogloeaceae bacterium]